MYSYRLQQIVVTLFLIGWSSALVIENGYLLDIPMEDLDRLRPVKKAGSLSARSVPANALCVECISQAKAAIDRFNQYTYLTYYEGMPNVTNSDQLFGIKTCREFKEIETCFNECISALTTVQAQEVQTYMEFSAVNSLQHIFCEARYTPGYASCRLADTHRCNRIRRNNCGDTLQQYDDCVQEILLRSGQDCSGHCTPARRYLRSQEFIWDMECSLKATFKSQCKDIVTIFCFDQVKDTELNYGTYQNMDSIPAMANSLEHTCQILESPFPCMETATNGFYDYFGLNVTYACRGAEDTMDAVKAQWESIIAPFCGANVSVDHRTIEDVCPIPDPANAPPEIPVTPAPTTTTTTERTWDFYQPKQGRCPVAIGAAKACDTVCGDDSHCSGTQKCCSSCCKEPMRRTSSRRPSFTGDSSQTPRTTSPKPVGPRTSTRAIFKAKSRASSKINTKANSQSNEPSSASSRTSLYLTLTLLLPILLIHC